MLRITFYINWWSNENRSNNLMFSSGWVLHNWVILKTVFCLSSCSRIMFRVIFLSWALKQPSWHHPPGHLDESGNLSSCQAAQPHSQQPKIMWHHALWFMFRCSFNDSFSGVPWLTVCLTVKWWISKNVPVFVNRRWSSRTHGSC